MCKNFVLECGISISYLHELLSIENQIAFAARQNLLPKHSQAGKKGKD